jgi:LacI family transcriptional regulator
VAVTRNDVARMAGVSPAVVSYVLNSGPRPVSARAIEDSAYARGYAVMVCNSADDLERERAYIASLAERRIDGLILISATSGQDLTDFTQLAIPIVALDRSPDESPVSTIRADNEDGAYQGTRHLLEHGHREIAFVGGPDTGVSDARRQGWLRALRDRGFEPGAECRATFSFEGGHGAAGILLASTRPMAVLVSSDIQAIGLISGLRRAGLRVPDDIALVSIDGTTAGEYAVPSLTSIAQPVGRMGTTAVTHLIDNAREIIHLALDNRLVVRESCGCSSPARR